MQFRQLEMLVAVVEEGGISRAASKLFVTQPAVSGALRKLAEEIGTPIFQTCSRVGTSLTPIGKTLYEHALGILAMRDTAMQEIQNAAELQRGTVRVGTDETSGLYFLPSLAERFCRHYSRVKLQVQTHETDHLFRMLREEKLDVVIACRKPDNKDVVSLPLADDDLVLVMAPQHPLASRTSIAVHDLQQESILLDSNATAARTKLIESFEKLRVPLNVVVEAGSTEMIKKLAARSLGIGLLPRIAVQAEQDSGLLEVRPLQGMSCDYQICATRRDTTELLPVVRSFIEVVRAHATEKPAADDKVLVIPSRKPVRKVSAQVN